MIKADSFSSFRIAVVGDVMLDRYWFGNVSRISPEAPVPVLQVTKEESRVGGAANVAHNIVALGANCQLLSVIGDDEAGAEVKDLIRASGVKANLFADSKLRTIVKLRMLAQNQQLLRADFEHPPSDEVLAQCLKDYAEALPDVDAVVLSDYGKGGLRHVERMIEGARQHEIPVIIDPKGTRYNRYKGATMITPNLNEFEAVCGVIESEQDFTDKAQELREQLDLDYLLVTRSEQGMSLFNRLGKRVDAPTQAREVYDVSGAGDTVISMMALSLLADLSDEERLRLANVAASVVIAKIGTAVASIEEILTKLELLT